MLPGKILGEGKTSIHPNEDVNKLKSPNNIFPTAIPIAAYKILIDVTIPGMENGGNASKQIVLLGKVLTSRLPVYSLVCP